MKKLLKKADIYLIVILLAACTVLFLPKLFSKSEGLTVKVYEDGKLTHSIILKEVKNSYEISVSGGKLLIEDDGVTYIEADCPDKTCQKFGKLKKAGDTASCVPNKTVVMLTGENKTVDVMTY